MTPLSTWLDHLSPFTHHLLYATILESTTAYQVLRALPYFFTNDTLIQLAILFRIYSTLHTLFTRATWCLAGAPNPFQTATIQESATILTLKQCLLEAWELTLNLLYVKEFNYAIFLLPFPIIDVVLSPVILSLLKSERLIFYTDNPLPTGLSQAYWAATMFSNSSLAINISQSSLTDRDDTISRRGLWHHPCPNHPLHPSHPSLTRLCHHPLVVNWCQHLLAHCSHDSTSALKQLVAGDQYPWPQLAWCS